MKKTVRNRAFLGGASFLLTSFSISFILSILFFGGAAFCPVLAEEQVAVVCPERFFETLKPWVAYRNAQGYGVHVLFDTDSPDTIRAQVRELAVTKPITHLLLVGDVDFVPVPYVPARVLARFGPEKEIATDNWYADLDDDDLPDIAVGRLTCDSPEELRIMLDKLITYESYAESSGKASETHRPENAPSRTGRFEWASRLHFIAGVGGFSPLLDTAIEGAARSILTEAIPPGYDVSFTQASWTSPYCPDPGYFRTETVGRFNEGGLFCVYMGHGYHRALDALRTPLGDFPILLEGDAHYLDCREGLPIVFFCACYTGAIDATDDSLAEEMLARPNGPVAVVAATRTTMPYAMSVLGIEMLDGLFHDERRIRGNETPESTEASEPSPSPRTLGTLFLQSKRRMIGNANSGRNGNAVASSTTGSLRGRIDMLAKLLDPTRDRLDDQLIDHIEAFTLLGDPLLRLHRGKPVELQAEPVAGGIAIRGKIRELAADGSVRIELAVPLTRCPAAPVKRETFDYSDTQREEYRQTYRAANNRVLHSLTTTTRDGAFEATLPLPEDDAAGKSRNARSVPRYAVRVYFENDTEYAIGGTLF